MSIKPVFVEAITEAKTYPAIVGRIVRCSPFVTVTDSGLSHWNFTIRGHGASFISASGFNLPKRFPAVAALEGKVVLVSKMQVVANKKEFLRFGAFGARFKEATTVTVLQDDATIPTDVPPLIDSEAIDLDLKRPRSTSTVAVTPRNVCPMKCRCPDSFICGKTGEPHVIQVCEFCNEAFDAIEPWCRIRRGHRHSDAGGSDVSPVEDTTVITTSSTTSSPPVRPLTASIAPEEEDMVPVTY